MPLAGDRLTPVPAISLVTATLERPEKLDKSCWLLIYPAVPRPITVDPSCVVK